MGASLGISLRGKPVLLVYEGKEIEGICSYVDDEVIKVVTDFGTGVEHTIAIDNHLNIQILD